MIHVDDFSGSDDEKIVQALEARAAISHNLGVTIVFAERRYNLTKPFTSDIRNTSLVSAGSHMRSTELQFSGDLITNDTSLVTMVKPFGAVFKGFRISAKAGEEGKTGIVGLHCISASSSKFVNFESYLKGFGRNSIGVLTTRADINAESSTWQGFNATASMPFVFDCGGDNCQIRDFDLTGVPGGVSSSNVYQSSVIQLGPTAKASNLVIGPGSGQLCNRAFYAHTETTVGSGLTLSGYRWEQGESPTASYVAFDIDMVRMNNGVRVHANERLTIENCRCSPGGSKYAFMIRGILDGQTVLSNNYWGNLPEKANGRPY